MTDETIATRRSFLKGGAVAAVPIAATGAAALIAEQDHQARLARLEAEAAIRDLHQAWLRHVNTGAHAQAAALFADPRAGLHEALSGVVADHAGAPDATKLAADGLSASGVYTCVVETEVERPRDCTLNQMAHAQGEGMIRSAQRQLLKARYVKTGQGWAIETHRFEAG